MSEGHGFPCGDVKGDEVLGSLLRHLSVLILVLPAPVTILIPVITDTVTLLPVITDKTTLLPVITDKVTTLHVISHKVTLLPVITDKVIIVPVITDKVTTLPVISDKVILLSVITNKVTIVPVITDKVNVKYNVTIILEIKDELITFIWLKIADAEENTIQSINLLHNHFTFNN